MMEMIENPPHYRGFSIHVWLLCALLEPGADLTHGCLTQARSQDSDPLQ